MKNQHVSGTTIDLKVKKRKALFRFSFYSLLIIAFSISLVVLFSSIAPWRSTQIYLMGATLAVFGLIAVPLKKYFSLFPSIALVSFVFLNISAYTYSYLNYSSKNLPSLSFVNSEQFEERLMKNWVENSTLERLLRQENTLDLHSDEISNLLENKIKFYKYPAVAFETNIDWSADPFSDPSWNWNLHNMGFISKLVQEYRKTKKIDYLEKAEEMILNWISENSSYFISPPSQFSWNDHSTAFRLLNWIYFLESWKHTELFDSGKAKSMLSSMLGHANKLATPNFYTDKHNHGIDQDRALLTFSTVYPFFKQSESWTKLATRRVIEQFDFSVSPNGVHLEHSPEYHLYGMEQLQQMITILEVANSEKEDLTELKSKLAKMQSFVPLLLKPDGNIVQVGDTGTRQLEGYDELLHELIEFPSNVSNKTSSNLVNYFICDGYASIRNFVNDRSKFANSFYLFFNAGAHFNRGHRQSDDLSFVLSNLGDEILIDPGYYSYRSDKGREYVKSVFAHNSVSINGQNYHGYKTKFEYIAESTERDVVVIKGSHGNFDSIEHHRSLVWVEENSLIVIDDFLPITSTNSKLDFVEQYFHFSPELDLSIPTSKPDRVQILRNDGTIIANLLQLGKQSHSINIVEGQEKPFQGWHSNKHATLVPSPTLITHSEGDAPLFTLIYLPDSVNETQQETEFPKVNIQQDKRIYTLEIKTKDKTHNFTYNSVKKSLLNIDIKKTCE